MVYQKKYSWGKKHHGVKAEIAGAVMEKIESRDGQVTKEALLDEARPEESPMHPAFEWNDGIAAEKYRLVQARHIINELVVTIERSGDNDHKNAPAFVNVVLGKENNAKYRSIETAINDDEMRKAVLKNALVELKQFEKKYRLYNELSKVFVAIHEIEGGMTYQHSNTYRKTGTGSGTAAGR